MNNNADTTKQRENASNILCLQYKGRDIIGAGPFVDSHCKPFCRNSHFCHSSLSVESHEWHILKAMMSNRVPTLSNKKKLLDFPRTYKFSRTKN